MAIANRRSVSGFKPGENSDPTPFSARERIENEKFLMRLKKHERRMKHGGKMFGSTGQPKGPAKMMSMKELNEARRLAKKEETK